MPHFSDSNVREYARLEEEETLSNVESGVPFEASEKLVIEVYEIAEKRELPRTLPFFPCKFSMFRRIKIST